MPDRHDCKLTVHFCAEEWLLSVCDSANKPVSTKQFPAYLPLLSEEDIVRIIAKEPEMQKKYASTRFIYESDQYSFVPAILFRENETSDMLYFQHEKDKIATVHFNLLENWKMVNLFSVPQALNNALLHFYPNPAITHHLTYCLTNLVKRPSNNKVHIWLRGRKMDVVAVKNGDVELINTYDYQTSEDFLYYLLHIFEQLSLDIENCKVQLHNAEQKKELVALAGKYFKCEKPKF